MCENNLKLVFFKPRGQIRKPKADPINKEPLQIDNFQKARELNLRISMTLRHPGKTENEDET